MSRKKKLQDRCTHMLERSYTEGGIASDNEYNQFLCDAAPEMVKYMTVDGLVWLKGKMDRIYENMIETDKW